jgi:hypothetical protein
MPFLPIGKIPYELMLTRWASILNPVLGLPTNQPNFLEGVKLVMGNNVINHKLNRKLQGWIITDITASASIYRSAPINDLTLTLNSSALTTVNLMVF